MNYTHNTKPDTDALEVAEPATLCYGGGSAIAEPDWDDDVDYGAPESVTVHSYEELCQKLEEGLADVRAGRVRPFDEAMRDFWRDIENDKLFEELQSAEANRLAGAKTYTISEVSERLRERINGKI